MRRRRRKGGGRARGTVHVQRVAFPIEERVERVGPKRFGILAVDSSKPRYSVLLAGFYRNELLWRLDIPGTAPPRWRA